MILYFYLSLTHLALPPELHPYRLSVHHRDLLDHLPDQLIVELRVSLGVLLDTRPHLLSLRFLLPQVALLLFRLLQFLLERLLLFRQRFHFGVEFWIIHILQQQVQ